MPRTVIEETRDRARLFELFRFDPIKNAYQIGSLADGYQDQTRHYWWTEKDVPKAVLSIYDGLSAPAVFTWGDPDCLVKLVERLRGELPGRMLVHRYPEHARAFDERLKVRSVRKEIRMLLERDRFRPPQAATEGEAVRLSHLDTAAIFKLFATYPDSFFEPYQLETGYYTGQRIGDELVSVAGIHLISEELGYAMLGNIVTSAEHRGKGLAKATTARLCETLFPFADRLILDVPTDSAAARTALEHLGFQPCFHYEQVLIHKGTGWIDE